MAHNQHDHTHGSQPIIKEEPFRLLDLPPELWSRICKLAVVHHEPIFVNAHSGRFGLDALLLVYKSPKSQELISPDRRHQLTEALCTPAITRTCRVVRTECLSTFYSSNIFFGWSDGHHFQTVTGWWKSLPDDAKKGTKFVYYVKGLYGDGAPYVDMGFPLANVDEVVGGMEAEPPLVEITKMLEWQILGEAFKAVYKIVPQV